MSLYKATKYCISVQHILLSLDISSTYEFLVRPKAEAQTLQGILKSPLNRIDPKGVETITFNVSRRVPQHRNEMTDAARDDEQVPDKVKVTQTFQRVEHHSDRVGDTARHQPEQAPGRNVVDDRTGGDQDEPAHREIDRDR